MTHRIFHFSVLACLFFIGGCSLLKSPDTEKPTPELRLVLSEFSALPHWEEGGQAGVLPAFKKSCARILKRPADQKFHKSNLGGTYQDWIAPCQALDNLSSDHHAELRQFFETYFTPYLLTAEGEEMGLFTGYYEPELNGSSTQTATYNTPLYLRPDNLVMVHLGEFRDDLKGRRIAGYVQDGVLKPYADRAKIEMGALSGQDLELVWVDSAIDAFFLHIQGSGRIKMTDGEIIRVGYAGQNGHPYFAIGRELIKRGALTKETVSLQSIEAWLKANPDQASEVMNLNPSYVFFHKLDQEEGPLGGEGVALTPLRSLAIDRTKIPYGAPIYLQAEHPVADPSLGESFTQLMMAQDTGGAIRGVVRGDVFWGHGDQAAHFAGHMKSQGKYWIFLPRTVTVPDELMLRSESSGFNWWRF